MARAKTQPWPRRVHSTRTHPRTVCPGHEPKPHDYLMSQEGEKLGVHDTHDEGEEFVNYKNVVFN